MKSYTRAWLFTLSILRQQLLNVVTKTSDFEKMSVYRRVSVCMWRLQYYYRRLVMETDNWLNRNLYSNLNYIIKNDQKKSFWNCIRQIIVWLKKKILVSLGKTVPIVLSNVHCKIFSRSLLWKYLQFKNKCNLSANVFISFKKKNWTSKEEIST